MRIERYDSVEMLIQAYPEFDGTRFTKLMKDFGLDRIFLLPSKISPHRSSAEYASGEDRLEMLRLACEGTEGLEVSDYEIKSDRVSYTIYTVEHFRSLFPDDELYLLERVINSDLHYAVGKSVPHLLV